MVQRLNLRMRPSADECPNILLVSPPKSCYRCGGFFNREWPFRDAGGGKEFFHSGVLLFSLRCVSCGEVIDPVILKNRTVQAQLALKGKTKPGDGKVGRRRKFPVGILT